MMTKNLLTAAVFIFSTQAFAVTTKNCPATINVSYEALMPFSDDKLVTEFMNAATYYDDKNEALEVITGNKDEHGEHTLKEIHQMLRNTQPAKFQKLEMILVEKARSQCRYKYTDDPRRYAADGETRLFTRDGRDILRVSIKIGETYVWIYHNVDAYSTAGLEISKTDWSPILGWHDDGSPRYKIGFAKNLSLGGNEKAEASVDQTQIEEVVDAAVQKYYKRELAVTKKMKLFAFEIFETQEVNGVKEIEVGVGVDFVRDPEGGIADYCNLTIIDDGSSMKVKQIYCSEYD